MTDSSFMLGVESIAESIVDAIDDGAELEFIYQMCKEILADNGE